MSLITWNQSLSVNVKEFDSQHMSLVNMVNKLYDSLEMGKGKDMLGKIINDLINYTTGHFADEEQLMAACAYPERSAHKAEHDNLVNQVLELQKQFMTGQGIIALAVVLILKEWLIRHILGDDKKYGAFFRSKGVR
jgi:hemerythrin